MFFIFVSLSLFFLLSKRMNARLEAIPHAAQRPALQQEQDAPQPQSDVLAFFRGARNRIRRIWQWLATRPVNVFIMLFLSWMVKKGFTWIRYNNIVGLFHTARQSDDESQLLIFLGWALAVSLLFSLLLLPFFLVRANREFYFDVTALFLLLCLSFYKLFFCATNGCCFGVPWSWGIYNHHLDTIVFPVQLFEFGVGVFLSFLCVMYMLFGKSYKPGRGCSFVLISFAVPRFVWEYLRYFGEEYRLMESNKLFGLSMVQIVCLVCLFVAVAWLFLLPLEKKLMDRFHSFIAQRWHRLRKGTAKPEGGDRQCMP